MCRFSQKSVNPEPGTRNPEPFFPEWPLLLALLLVGLVLFFYQLGAAYLMDPDEGRYAEIAREMLILKDWLIPHLNLLPYLEKPPLVYWLTAISFKVFGFSAGAARLPSAVSALAGLFLAYGLGRAFWGTPAGALGALVLATCTGYVALGRILTLDMTFAFFLNLAIGLGYLALSRERPGLWLWAYLALALAVLTKGPVAVVLAGLIWIIWVWINHWPWRTLINVRGWLLLVILTLPWLAYVQWRYPEFFHFFIIEQHFARFLTPAIHPEPLYYYLPVLLALLLPWTWLLPWGLGRGNRWGDPDYRFLVVWAAVILTFFSLSQGKLVPYILPVLLPLALLLGRGLAYLTGPGRLMFNSRLLKTSLIVWAVSGLVLVALYFWTPQPLTRALSRANLVSPFLLMACLVWTLTPLTALIWRHLGALLLGTLLLSALLPPGINRVSRERSFRNMGLILKSEWQPKAALVGVQLYSQGLSFYSGHIFHLLGCRTELDFGEKLAPQKGLCLPDKAALGAFTAAHPVTFFFLKVHDLPWLAKGLPGTFHRLASHKDCILVSYKGK
ncbi:MAG: glycosyltransferase family 39 protein [Deltaproteobacteria bacterium]